MPPPPGPHPQECFINKVSTKDNKSEHEYSGHLQLQSYREKERQGEEGWPPEPKAQGSKETVVSWNVLVSLHPARGLCENYV